MLLKKYHNLYQAENFIWSHYFLYIPGEEGRAEFFMEELNNGVKLCELISALKEKVAQSCPSALCKVSQTAAMKVVETMDIGQMGSFHNLTAQMFWENSAGHSIDKYLNSLFQFLFYKDFQEEFCHFYTRKENQ